jgi:hypothetical protein
VILEVPRGGVEDLPDSLDVGLSVGRFRRSVGCGRLCGAPPPRRSQRRQRRRPRSPCSSRVPPAGGPPKGGPYVRGGRLQPYVGAVRGGRLQPARCLERQTLPHKPYCDLGLLPRVHRIDGAERIRQSVHLPRGRAPPEAVGAEQVEDLRDQLGAPLAGSLIDLLTRTSTRLNSSVISWSRESAPARSARARC